MIKNILRNILVLILCLQLVGCPTRAAMAAEPEDLEMWAALEENPESDDYGYSDDDGYSEVVVPEYPLVSAAKAEAKEAQQTASEEVSETEGEAPELSALGILGVILVLSILVPIVVVGGIVLMGAGAGV